MSGSGSEGFDDKWLRNMPTHEDLDEIAAKIINIAGGKKSKQDQVYRELINLVHECERAAKKCIP
ncbi:hypothetical protein [Pantoea stewartii]|uniref:hypothetical protein n=1 Tax=Pantoea stewartii TaxID=66269 RepID=UPI0025A07F80|nr:hypothetical protein [Pantoea stewartii]